MWMKKNKNTLIISSFTLLFLASCGDKKTDIPQQAQGIMEVETFKIVEEDLQRSVQVTGTILPFEQIMLYSEIAGRVQKIAFNEGQKVRKGALLVQVDTDILQAQRKQLLVELSLAKKDESRKNALLKSKGVSEEEYEKSASNLASIQAKIDLLEVQISKGKIVAPFEGKIGLRKISEGAYIEPATAISSLIQDQQLKLDFSISERYASLVKIGQEVRFKLKENAKIYVGKVYAFEPSIDVSTRMLSVRALIKNDGNLLSGTFVSVEFDLGVEQAAFMVPASAVIPVLKGQKVYVVVNGKIEEKQVELGIRTADKVQIIGELKQGDQVLISALLAVKPGMPVKVKNK